ncbi:MAG: hypothetical protein PGN29_02130 [Gordonia paraffinivorans]
MHHWYTHDIVAGGKLPLLLFFAGFVGGFVATRVSVRLIRADVRWWFRNVSAGQTHVHHMVFGVVLSLVSGVWIVAISMTATQAQLSWLACAFGVGAALILDEFALIFYLRDVYWAEEGRASVDAVFAMVGATGMALLGFRPLELISVSDAFDDSWTETLITVGVGLAGLVIAAIVVAKGKPWTALIGIFVFPLLLIGAIRLADPASPWARWRYTSRPKRMERAVRRERRQRRPLVRAKIFLQDLMAGSPDVAHAIEAAETELDRVVHPAPAPDPAGPRSSVLLSGPR